MRTTPRGGGKLHADKGGGSENRYFLRTTEGVILLSCSDGKRNDEHTLSCSVDRRVQRERRPVALRVVQQITKRGRTKAMTQSEIFVEGEPLEHMQHIAGDMAKFGNCCWSKCSIYSIQLHNVPSFLGYLENYLSP